MSATSTLPTVTSTAQRFEIRPLPGSVGAEIIGLDLSRPVNDEDFARIHRAHLDHHVVVFRDQRITPEQQIAFSRRFGVLQIHVLKQFLLANHPEILIVSNIIENGQSIGLGDAGKFWHSDLSYKELPSLGSMLHAQELFEHMDLQHAKTAAESDLLFGGDALVAEHHDVVIQVRAVDAREIRVVDRAGQVQADDLGTDAAVLACCRSMCSNSSCWPTTRKS